MPGLSGARAVRRPWSILLRRTDSKGRGWRPAPWTGHICMVQQLVVNVHCSTYCTGPGVLWAGRGAQTGPDPGWVTPTGNRQSLGREQLAGASPVSASEGTARRLGRLLDRRQASCGRGWVGTHPARLHWYFTAASHSSTRSLTKRNQGCKTRPQPPPLPPASRRPSDGRTATIHHHDPLATSL